MSLPFEQQPKESAKAFTAFSVYLNLGAERSLAKAAQKCAKSVPLLKRWSRRFGWAGRVAAYEEFLAGAELEVTAAMVRANSCGVLFCSSFKPATAITSKPNSLAK